MTSPDPAADSAYDGATVDRLGRPAFLQGLVDNTSEGLLAIDASSRIVFANPAVVDIFGYRPEELVGEPLTTVVPERLRQRHLDALERYLQTDERRLDWDTISLPGLHRAGHEVPLEISFREVRRDGERLFTGIIRDVTEREQAETERELLYSVSRAVAEAESVESGLQSAVERVCEATRWTYGEGWVPSEDGDHLVRAAGGGTTPEWVEAVESSGEVVALSPGSGLPGRVWASGESEWWPGESAEPPDVLPGTDAGGARRPGTALGVPIAAGEEVVAVLALYVDELLDSDGRLVETLEAVAAGLGGMVARKRSEDRLGRERARLDRVLETSPVGSYLVDAAGDLVRMNGRAEELLGVQQRDLACRPYAADDVLALDNSGAPLPDDRHPVARVLATGQAVRNFEHQLLLADGTRRWLSSNAAPIPGTDGRPEQVVVTVSDIAHRKAHERELERERDELQAELDEVLSRVADAFLAFDHEGVLTYVNEHAKVLIGRASEELVGEPIWEQFPDAAESTFRTEFARTMETQEPSTFEAFYPPLSAWFEVNAYPSETGLSVYFRDVTERKRYETTLSMLHEATHDLVRSTSSREVAERVIQTAVDAIDLPAVAVYRFDSTESLLEPVACSDGFRAAHRDLPTYRPGEGMTGRVFVDGTPADHDGGDGRGVEADPPLARAVAVPLGEHGVFVAGAPEPGTVGEQTRELVRILARVTETALDRLAQERDLRERDRVLAERNRQLRKLNRINGVIRRIDQVLVDASTRAEVEEAVCERLADSGPFAFAWIGELDSDTGAVTPRCWDGDEQGYLDAVHAIEDAGAGAPSGRAAESREPVAVADVSDGLREEPWRREALVRGFQSVIGVPLLFDGFLYGVLTVYSAESDAFDERTAEVFGELGFAIGNGINAVETKQGLLFDRVVELDVRIRETDDALHRLAADASCDVEFEGLIPDTGRSVVFFSTEGVAADRVRSFVEGHRAMDHLRLVADQDGACLFEAGVSGGLVAATVVDYGGVPRSITTDGGELRAVLDLPRTTDVRDFVERLRGDHPDAELVARRERERSVETRHGFMAELEEHLTDRQLEVLRTAYLSGYFDEPRQSSGQEVGDALGITQPTFSSHLRAAQRRLLAKLFDAG